MSQGTERGRAQDTKTEAQEENPDPTTLPWYIALQGISLLLNTRLSKTALHLCIELLEAGVNPHVLTDIIEDIRRDKDEPKVFKH